MTLRLATRVRALFPSASPISDYRIHDDGSGPYIAHWDEAKLGPRPTQGELDAVDVAKIEHNAAIDAQITAVEAQITQRMLRDAAAGNPPKEYRELVARIDELRGQRRK